jgi:RNA-directed DNA polymerase
MLIKFALEPEWEAVFEPNSYGFRPGRSCHDAIASLWLSLRSGIRNVLDADIQKCFDTIDHDLLLKKLNTFSIIEKQVQLWLKAGVMEGYTQRPKSELTVSHVGVPQGSIISPLLANIALHGLETACKEHYANQLWSGDKSIAKRDRRAACSIVRYADDFIAITRTENELQGLRDFIVTWLETETGLKLSEERTKMRRSTEGFNFLGFHIIYLLSDKGQRPTLRIHISRDGKKRFLENTRTTIQSLHSASAAHLITTLNPKIVGWCNYYRYCTCTYDFKTVEYALWGQIRAWAFRRKSKGLRSREAIKHKYFPENYQCIYNGVKHKNNWVLVGETRGRQDKVQQVHLVQPSWIRSKTYTKIRGDATPYDGNKLYWSERTEKYSKMSQTERDMFKKQNKCC